MINSCSVVRYLKWYTNDNVSIESSSKTLPSKPQQKVRATLRSKVMMVSESESESKSDGSSSSSDSGSESSSSDSGSESGSSSENDDNDNDEGKTKVNPLHFSIMASCTHPSFMGFQGVEAWAGSSSGGMSYTVTTNACTNNSF